MRQNRTNQVGDFIGEEGVEGNDGSETAVDGGGRTAVYNFER
jgi:hypothetical protein